MVVLTTEIVVGLSSVIVISSPDIEVVNVVVTTDVVTMVLGIVIVERETFVTVGPGTVVGIVVGTTSVKVRVTSFTTVEVI